MVAYKESLAVLHQARFEKEMAQPERLIVKKSPEYLAALANVRSLQSDLRRWKKEDKQAQKLLRTVYQLPGHDVPPVVAEAVDLLEDKDLEWSSDFSRIRPELSTLLRFSLAYPTLKPVVIALCEELIYDNEDNDVE